MLKSQQILWSLGESIEHVKSFDASLTPEELVKAMLKDHSTDTLDVPMVLMYLDASLTLRWSLVTPSPCLTLVEGSLVATISLLGLKTLLTRLIRYYLSSSLVFELSLSQAVSLPLVYVL